MLTAIEVFPEDDPRTNPRLRIVFRGTLVANNTPFVTELTGVALEDLPGEVESALITNAVEWGVYDDVS